MNRRGFFGSLIAALAAPFVAKSAEPNGSQVEKRQKFHSRDLVLSPDEIKKREWADSYGTPKLTAVRIDFERNTTELVYKSHASVFIVELDELYFDYKQGEPYWDLHKKYDFFIADWTPGTTRWKAVAKK